MSNAPTFVARFDDGTITRMTTSTPLAKLDVARGVKLARWAYRSRQQCEPPAIIEARFEQDGTTLATYDAGALAAAGSEALSRAKDRADAVATTLLELVLGLICLVVGASRARTSRR
jgi:hypothetical protein